MSSETTPTPTPTLPSPLPPTPPYAVSRAKVGPGDGKECEFKVYPGGVPGEFLSGDESKVWRYVEHLATENLRLAGELEAARVKIEELEHELGNAIPAPPDTTGAAAKGKGKR